MKTSRPISTISWNTPSYLEQVLSELIKSKVISFWCYICHQGEDDEAGKKNHIHLYLEPAKSIQTVELKELFNEPDAKNKKPLGCLDFRPSKFKDWYFYALHDAGYLQSKALVRKYHYSPENLKKSDDRELQYRVGTIELYTSSTVDKMIRLYEAGKDFEDMVLSGVIPAGNFSNMQRIYAVVERMKSAKRLQAVGKNGCMGIVPNSQDPFLPGAPIDVPLPFDGTINMGVAKDDDDLLINQNDLPPQLRDI